MAQIDLRARTLITSVSNHAFRLLDIAQLKALIIIENADGDRFWSGNGRLRNEFINEGRVDNRSWGMFTVKDNVIEPSTCIINAPAPARTGSPLPTRTGSPVPTRTSSVMSISSEGLSSLHDESVDATKKIEDVENDMVCLACYQLGHASFECPSLGAAAVENPSKTASLAASLPCLYCKKAGHKVRVCPSLPQGSRFCLFCCEVGHNLGDCLQRLRDIQAGRILRTFCDLCKIGGHNIGTCEKKSSNAIFCFRCLKLGHMMDRCSLGGSVKAPQINAVEGGGGGGVVGETATTTIVNDLSIPMVCSCCNLLGHAEHECPMKEGDVNGGKAPTGQGSVKCFKCGEHGHKVQHCEAPCFICGKKGHFSSECGVVCFRCGVKGHKADKCQGKRKEESVRSVRGGPRRGKCFVCGNADHKAKECGVKCFKCGGMGHKADKCPSVKRKSVEKDEDEDKKCHTCGGLGHTKRNCGAKPPKGKACHYCKEMGHMMTECVKFWNEEGKKDKTSPRPTDESKRPSADKTSPHPTGVSKRPSADKTSPHPSKTSKASSDISIEAACLFDSSKTLKECLKSFKAQAKLRFTWLPDDEKFLISVSAGQKDTLKKVDSKAELQLVLSDLGFKLET